MSFLGHALFGGGESNFQAANAPTAEQMAQSQQQTQQALQQQQAFANAVGAQVPGAIGLQQGLAGQLQAQALGQGPNPAQAALAQATGQNVANQAALAAGQRGASANSGLMARQVGQQGGNLQQQAVGQASTMQAQQQLAAQQQLQNLAGNQINQASGGANSLSSAALGNQGQMINANQGANQLNQQVAMQNAKADTGILGGLLGGVGQVAGGLLGGGGLGQSLAAGLGVKKEAEGGMITPQMQCKNLSYAHKFLGGLCNKSPMMAKGGSIPAMVSPGEEYIPPQNVAKVAMGQQNPLAAGVKFPGQPKVKCDSFKNDTIKTNLETGGVVIPNHVMQSDNPADNAKKFVQAVLAKQSLKRAKK